MVLLFSHPVGSEPQGCLDILALQVVFMFVLLEAHSPGQAAHNEGHGHTGTTNYGLAVADSWINHNTVVHGWGG